MFCFKLSIPYIYDTTGIKLEKEVNDAQFAGATYTYYAGNYIYKKGNSQGQQDVALTFFNTEEGYIEPVYEQVTTTSTFGTFTRTVLSDFEYTYQYKDHLGNIRLSYQDMNEDGIIDAATEIKEENHYYPFGLKMKGFNNAIVGRDHNYGYNGIEESNELGNNMLEMDLRQYDPAIARWVVIDPVTHHDYSPYQAFDNNPIFWADPSGADSQITDDGNAISFRGEAAGQAFAAIRDGLSVAYGDESCDCECPNPPCDTGSSEGMQRGNSPLPIGDRSNYRGNSTQKIIKSESSSENASSIPLAITGTVAEAATGMTVASVATVASVGLLVTGDGTPQHILDWRREQFALHGKYFSAPWAESGVDIVEGILNRNNSSGYYIHYTTIENAYSIWLSKSIYANSSNKVYVTNALMTLIEAFTVLFQAQPTHKGRGDAVIIMKLYNSQQANLRSEGGDIFEQYHVGNLKPSKIIYAGPNPFGG